MVREPEWDERSTAEQLALSYLDDNTCGDCGGYLPQATRTDVGRDVLDRDLHTAPVCLDCDAIRQVRDRIHKQHPKVKPGDSDPCDHIRVWVDSYLPLPDDD